MKKLFTETEYKNAKCNDLLSVQCYECGNTFVKNKYTIKRCLLGEDNHAGKYCSKKCSGKAKCKYGMAYSLVNCLQCNKEFEKRNSQIAQTKNHFCNHSCAATYNNTHKKTGNRRSKLEVWIEQQLTNDYPNLTIKYNDKIQIGSELDVFIENFKLAFELNGIFHYEAIYGENKLNQIQNNDNQKFTACLEKGIELCVIDSSGLKYFKPDNAKKYYDIIKKIIDKKI